MADKISITICGDGGCGKSSITLRLVRSQWMNEYDPTIEDSYSVTRTIDGTPYSLSITDTAGQEEYRELWAMSNLKSDAFLLVYDVTSLPTLHALDYFIGMIGIEAEQREENNYRLRKELGQSAKELDVGMPPPVKIVAGNKCDLKDLRTISAKDGLECARKHGCGFMETSAREMVNIEETFALIVRRVIEARRQHYGHASSNGHVSNGTTHASQKQKTTTPEKASGNNDPSNTDIRLSGLSKWKKTRMLWRGKPVATEQQASSTAKTKNGTLFFADRTSTSTTTMREKLKRFWRRFRC